MHETNDIHDLVQEVLQALQTWNVENITDLVCVAIEANPTWPQQYDDLIEKYNRAGTKDGLNTVNTSIGGYTREITGFDNLGEGYPARSSLIKTYSRLGTSKSLD